MAQGALDSSCAAITDGELAEAGFHQQGEQTWLVLAAPFSPPGAAQAGNMQARVLALVNQARARPRRCGNESFAAARPCCWLVSVLNQRRLPFCMRVEKSGNGNFACVRDFLRSALTEKIVMLRAPNKPDSKDYVSHPGRS